MIKSLCAPLALAATLASFGSLRAQAPAPEPGASPTQSIPTATQSMPLARDPALMSKSADKPVGKRLLEKYDTNKNGVLDADEKAEFEKDAPARKADKLKKYDKDGDGKLDEKEKVQMRVDRLREADATKKSAKDKTDAEKK